MALHDCQPQWGKGGLSLERVLLSDWHPCFMQVGVTAMLIASKYEEIWAPEVNDFVYISDKAYSR